MLDRINALMENESTKILISENEEIITEAVENAQEFSKVLKEFVINNPEEFLGENTEETYKNIRLFAEVATAQYMTEITNLYSTMISESKVEKEDGIEDYL